MCDRAASPLNSRLLFNLTNNCARIGTRHYTVMGYPPNYRAASNIATMFSGGTFAWMLWTEPKTNPPAPAMS